MITCKNPKCLTEFQPHNKRQLYCASACYKRAKANRSFERRGCPHYGSAQCEQCKCVFQRGKRTTRFCSNVCAGRSKRKIIDIPIALIKGSRKLDKNLGYVRVYCPMHPEANTWGYVYEHRLIAEQIIGRSLYKDEIVHHKNGKRWDNRKENLEVMSKYEHGQLHGQRVEDLNI